MEDYQYLIESALDQYDSIGRYFSSGNLGHNLLVWMAFSDHKVFKGGKQVMALTGSPKSVFNRRRITAQLGSTNVTCDVRPSLSYNAQGGRISISYNTERFDASPSCMSIIDFPNLTNTFAESWLDDKKDYVIDIDVSSLVTAAAVNSGILATYEIEMIPHSEYLMPIQGVDYLTAMFFYPYFSDMDPLHCVYRPGINTSNQFGHRREELFCALRLAGNYFAIPSFNHAGKSFNLPTPCDCSTEEKNNSATQWLCNQFQFVSGFVFYRSVEELAEFALENYRGRSGEALSADVFNASFGTLSHLEELRGPSDWRTRAFDFCELRSGERCAVLSIFTGDADQIFSVNGDYLQLPWGSCNDTISVSNTSRARLVSTPPTPLSEPYYECQKYARSTIYEEFSSAVGIVIPLRLLMVVCLAFVLFGMATRDERRGENHTHTFKDKQRALDFFAHVLLLIRDGRVDTSGNKKYDVETLSRLQHELHLLGDDVPKFFEVELSRTSSASSVDSAGGTGGGRSKSACRDSVENPLRRSDQRN